MGGGIYNTGPHPIGIGLAFLDFADDFRVEYSKLGLGLTSGDAEDYAKIILTAPGKPVVDVEVSSLDAFSDFNIKIQGSRGTYKCTTAEYKTKYIVDGENPERPVILESLKNEEGLPVYCSEKLVAHTEEGKFGGSAFDAAVESYYKMIYENIRDGKPIGIGGDPSGATAEKGRIILETKNIFYLLWFIFLECKNFWYDKNIIWNFWCWD